MHFPIGTGIYETDPTCSKPCDVFNLFDLFCMYTRSLYEPFCGQFIYSHVSVFFVYFCLSFLYTIFCQGQPFITATGEAELSFIRRNV